MIELLVSVTIECNYFHLKLSSFVLVLVPTAVNKDFAKLNVKKLVIARFVKLRGKKSIIEFNLIKVVHQKSDTVINIELFLNVSWNYWNGLEHEVKGNSKRKVYGLYFDGNKAKGRISKRAFQGNKARQIFQKTNISYPLIPTRTYQGVRNVRFTENLMYFVFLKHPFWDSPFCFITDDLWDCGLNFPRNLGGKSNIRCLIGENLFGGKCQIFLEVLSLFPVENFPPRKLSLMKIFHDENFYLLNTFFSVEINAEE